MILFFDIETISSFNKRERKSKSFLLLKEKYEDRLNFMPEFNKILTIAVWYQFQENIQVKNLEWSEEEQIKHFFEVIKNNKLSWYNIKGFDLPFIVKRAIKYGITIPEQIKAYNKKPREFDNIIDLQEIWKHIWYSACSLDVLCNFLWITSPKDFWIDWSQVQEFYDNKKEKEIIDYCKRDVEATIKVYDYFKKYNLI